jgi:transposase
MHRDKCLSDPPLMPRLTSTQRQAALESAAAATPVVEIAHMSGVWPSTIYRTIDRDAEENPRPVGHPVIHSEEDVDRCEELLRDLVLQGKDLNWSSLVGEVHRLLSIKISRRTLREHLQRRGWTLRASVVRPVLSAATRAKRLTWCKKYSRTSHRFWVFSDECKIEIFRKPRKVITRRGETRQIKFRPNPVLSVQVWGGVSYDGRTPLHFLEGRLDGEGHKRNLEEFIADDVRTVAGRRGTLLQDNAPAHTSRIALRTLAELELPYVFLPPTSPDLNAVENVWKDLKLRVQERDPQTLAGLKDAVHHAWHAIPQAIIQHHIAHLADRKSRIILNHGGPLARE